MKPSRKRPPAKTTISLRLSPDHLKRLEKLVKKKGASRTGFIQIAVSEYLEKEERRGRG